MPGDWASGPDHDLRGTWEISSDNLRVCITLGRTHLLAHGLHTIPAGHSAADFDLQRISVRVALAKPQHASPQTWNPVFSPRFAKTPTSSKRPSGAPHALRTSKRLATSAWPVLFWAKG